MRRRRVWPCLDKYCIQERTSWGTNVCNWFNASNVSPFRASSVNEDYEYKIGLCKKPCTIVECQDSLIFALYNHSWCFHACGFLAPRWLYACGSHGCSCGDILHGWFVMIDQMWINRLFCDRGARNLYVTRHFDMLIYYRAGVISLKNEMVLFSPFRGGSIVLTLGICTREGCTESSGRWMKMGQEQCSLSSKECMCIAMGIGVKTWSFGSWEVRCVKAILLVQGWGGRSVSCLHLQFISWHLVAWLEIVNSYSFWSVRRLNLRHNKQ